MPTWHVLMNCVTNASKLANFIFQNFDPFLSKHNASVLQIFHYSLALTKVPPWFMTLQHFSLSAFPQSTLCSSFFPLSAPKPFFVFYSLFLLLPQKASGAKMVFSLPQVAWAFLDFHKNRLPPIKLTSVLYFSYWVRQKHLLVSYFFQIETFATMLYCWLFKRYMHILDLLGYKTEY